MQPKRACIFLDQPDKRLQVLPGAHRGPCTKAIDIETPRHHLHGMLNFASRIEQVKIKHRLALKRAANHFVTAEHFQGTAATIGILGQQPLDMFISQSPRDVGKDSDDRRTTHKANRPLLAGKKDMIVVDLQAAQQVG